MTRLVALLALTLSLLTASPAAEAYGPEDIGPCSDGGPRPCVVSVLRDGAPLDDSWSFVAQYWRGTAETGNSQVTFSAMRPGDGFDLGFDALGDTWEVTLDVGDVVPRGVMGHAQDTVVDRDGSLVTVTGRPVTISGQCDPDNRCPEWADDPDPVENAQWDGAFDFQVIDFGGWEDAPSLEAVYGIELFTNIATTSIPPVIRHDEATGSDYLWIEMANRHYYEDGTTVVRGQLDLRIPNAFLRAAYGVPNPELMSTDGLDPEVTGRAAGSGTVSVEHDTDRDAMLVNIAGVTFSHRVAKILRGVIVPTRPQNFITHRITPTSSELFFTSAEARGAKVRAHEARCTPIRGRQPVVTERGGRAPIIIDGLTPGTTYDCRVRGLSEAGPGPWSKAMRS